MLWRRNWETVKTSTAPQGSPSATQSVIERLPDHAIYKPNGRGSGGVVRFGLNPAKAALFVDAAAQCGERKFDWDGKFTMKWGLSDLGAVLAVLRHHQAEAKLFHRSEHANSAFDLVRSEDPERPPLRMSMSRQEASDKSLRKVGIPLTHADAALLEVVLDAAVRRLVGW